MHTHKKNVFSPRLETIGLDRRAALCKWDRYVHMVLVARCWARIVPYFYHPPPTLFFFTFFWWRLHKRHVSETHKQGLLKIAQTKAKAYEPPPQLPFICTIGNTF